MALILNQQAGAPPSPSFLYIAALGAAAGDRAMEIARDLRRSSLRVEMAYDAKPNALGKLLERADKRGARLALILGEEELTKGIAKVKDLRSGEQEDLRLDASPETLAGLLAVRLEA